MTTDELKQITQTIDGHLVKDLRWLPLDNIIVGLVTCPILKRQISGQWRKSGSPTNSIKGRNDLKLKINLVD